MANRQNPVPSDAQRIIVSLGLEPHPEGGWYRQTWKSSVSIPGGSLESFPGDRPCGTSIYFLMTAGNFSAFHRLRSEEMWYHHCGDALDIEILGPEGCHERATIGPAVDGYRPQALAPAGTWFGSRLREGGEWALVGCAVSPGFDFADFELAERDALISAFPEHRALIRALTR